MFDKDAEIEYIAATIRELLASQFRRRGLVVAMSGGIDSSVCAALAVEAVGKDRVFGLMLPESDSSPTNTYRGEKLASHLDIDYEVFDITPALKAVGCYRYRDQAIKRVFPDFSSEDGWKCKIIIEPGPLVNFHNLVVQTPERETYKERLKAKDYLQIVAATNFKQRIRKTMEYFHADRLNYAVVGTPNRVEYDQGFFVKNGDGSADIKPIAHLYKTQVYALARHMRLPEEICKAVPSTDTYTLSQGQDEFYFSLPYDKMDSALYAYNAGISSAELAAAIGITEKQAAGVYTDIEAKRDTTACLHWNGVTMCKVNGPNLTPPTPSNSYNEFIL
jgi:NAD+ synthase